MLGRFFRDAAPRPPTNLTTLRVDFPLTALAARDGVHAPPEEFWPRAAHSTAPA
ncbi:hypothetical protein ABZ858_26885 [Streptomyces sp. NPDC047017]|uniref:hypothetical protein n=1 Tax=Streptomyces sp. NPDC047017 TaxID=3155024 RepID=UPI0034097C2F